MNKTTLRIIIACAVSVIVVTAVVVYVYMEINRTHNFEIHGFSMKSGNSQSQFFLVKTSEDKRIVINGGHNSGSLRKITSVLPFYSRRIDAIIVSDPSAKYSSGLVDIVERYEVGEAYLPAVSTSTDPSYSELQSVLKKNNVSMYYVKEGDQFMIGEKTHLNIFFPNETGKFVYTKSSKPEIIFSITNGDGRLLYLGNAGKKIQKYIASSSLEEMFNKDQKSSSRVAGVVILLNLADEADVNRELFSVLKYVYMVYSKDRTFPDNKKINLRQGGDVHFILDSDGFKLLRKR